MNGWETNPDYPNDGFYVDRIVECAHRLGLNPLTLTPEERQDLRRLGRILTPEERKEHAEAEAKYRVRPLTPEEMERWLRQYLNGRQANHQQMRYDLPPGEKIVEVIEIILKMMGMGIKAIIPHRRVGE